MPLLAEEEFTWVPEIWSGHLNNAAGFVKEAVNQLGQCFGVILERGGAGGKR